MEASVSNLMLNRVFTDTNKKEKSDESSAFFKTEDFSASGESGDSSDFEESGESGDSDISKRDEVPQEKGQFTVKFGL